MKKHIIFDLDGTLIDSAPSILESFKQAFSSLKIEPSVPITADIVGPPLMSTLARLSGKDDLVLLQQLAKNFKAHYDESGYKELTVYRGIQVLLEALKKRGHNLYIATNKRHLPTQKIMQFLNWSSFFEGVFALDSFSPPLTAKPLMVKRIMADYAINPADTIYVGDRYEDGLAADFNEIDFAMATWGYADQSQATLKPNWRICSNIKALQDLLVCF
ncbi:MAG TPA: HAD family hydrolase [Methylophilaceae bacterium]|nr:HAD family hydrolase [Methylophilaceae bacterium]